MASSPMLATWLVKGKTSSEGDIRALRQYDNVAIRFDEPIIALTEHYAVL